MRDPDQDTVEMVTEVLERFQKSGGIAPLLIGFIDLDEDVEIFAYKNCNYRDLRRFSSAIQDEAILKMIAVNQDRIDHFKEEDDNAE